MLQQTVSGHFEQSLEIFPRQGELLASGEAARRRGNPKGWLICWCWSGTASPGRHGLQYPQPQSGGQRALNSSVTSIVSHNFGESPLQCSSLLDIQHLLQNNAKNN